MSFFLACPLQQVEALASAPPKHPTVLQDSEYAFERYFEAAVNRQQWGEFALQALPRLFASGSVPAAEKWNMLRRLPSPSLAPGVVKFLEEALKESQVIPSDA